MQETRSITCDVITQFLPEQSLASEDRFTFAYQITITNTGSETMQLRNRYWLITDGNGAEQEVSGPGVIGEEPILASGVAFTYTSGAVLTTPVGTMQGHYEFENRHGELLKAPIPLFSLAVANVVN